MFANFTQNTKNNARLRFTAQGNLFLDWLLCYLSQGDTFCQPTADSGIRKHHKSRFAGLQYYTFTMKSIMFSKLFYNLKPSDILVPTANIKDPKLKNYNVKVKVAMAGRVHSCILGNVDRGEPRTMVCVTS